MESVNFDRAAEYYDATRALPAASMDELTAMLAAELESRQPCLEIGVGTGRVALPLRDRGVRLAGLDVAGAMLRRLVANAGDAAPVQLVQADATRLPVAAGAFGSVLAVHVLHLIPDWRVAVDEALRVLRPGGALVASFPGRPGASDEPFPWEEFARETLRRHGLVRARHGTRDAGEVAAYVRGRAAVRQLPPVALRQTRTLGQALANLEGQIFSWTWPYTQDQLRAAGSEIRAWAARENVSLDTGFEARSDIRWWAFDLPG